MTLSPKQHAKPTRTVQLFCLLSALLLAAPLPADVLVTKSGSKWKGKVEEKGDAYILVNARGGKMTFPKSSVDKIIRDADAKTPDTKTPAPAAAKIADPKTAAKARAAAANVRTAAASMKTAFTGLKLRHAREYKQAKPKPEDYKRALEYAKQNLKATQGAIKFMNSNNAPAARETLVGPSGRRFSATVTRQDAKDKLAEARQKLADVNKKIAACRTAKPPQELLDRHAAELKKYAAGDQLAKDASQAMKDAAKTVATAKTPETRQAAVDAMTKKSEQLIGEIKNLTAPPDIEGARQHALELAKRKIPKVKNPRRGGRMGSGRPKTISPAERTYKRCGNISDEAVTSYCQAAGASLKTAFSKMPEINEIWTTKHKLDTKAFEKYLTRFNKPKKR